MPGRCYFRLQKGSDSDVESTAADWYDVLIWEDGKRINRSSEDVLEYDMAVTGGKIGFGAGSKKVKYVDGTPTSVANDFDNNFGDLFVKENGVYKGVKHIGPYNSYNKRIDHSDLDSFVAVLGRTYGAYKMYGQLHDYRQQALSYNTGVDEAFARDMRTYTDAQASWPEDWATALQDAKDDWGNRLQVWQENEYTNDIVDFTNEGASDDLFPDPDTGVPRPLTSVEMIFSELVRQISPDVSQYWDPNVRNDTFWNLDPYTLTPLPSQENGGPGAWQRYKPPTLKPPTKPTKGAYTKVPTDTWEKLAKIYFVAEICLMGVVALLHLYEAVKGDPDATIRSSAWQVNYGPSLIQDNDFDGCFGRYVKQQLRARDVLGNIRSMLTALFSGIGKALGWVKATFGPEGCPENGHQCQRAQADAHKIGMAAVVETLKDWRKAVRAMGDKCDSAAIREMEFYEKDLLQHYAALEMQISTNMQVLGQLENLGAQHWPKSMDGRYPNPSKLTDRKMKYPAIFRVHILNPGYWGYIGAVEILDPGLMCQGGGDFVLSTNGGGLMLSGAGKKWGAEVEPRIYVKFEGGQAVAVRFGRFTPTQTLAAAQKDGDTVWPATTTVANAGLWGNPGGADGFADRMMFGRGYYSPPALVVDPRMYGLFAREGARGGMPIENGFHIAKPEPAQAAENECAGGGGCTHEIDHIETAEGEKWNKLGQTAQRKAPNSSAAQMAHKYEVLYNFAKGTLTSARRAVECRYMSRKDDSGKLDDIFLDGTDDDVNASRRHSQTQGTHTMFEQLEMTQHVVGDKKYAAKTRLGWAGRSKIQLNNFASHRYKSPRSNEKGPDRHPHAQCVEPNYAVQTGMVGNSNTANINWRLHPRGGAGEGEGVSGPTHIHTCFAAGWAIAIAPKLHDRWDGAQPTQKYANTSWRYTYDVGISANNETDYFPYCKVSKNVGGSDFGGWAKIVNSFMIRGQILYGQWTQYVPIKGGRHGRKTLGYKKVIKQTQWDAGKAVSRSLSPTSVIREADAKAIDQIYTVSWKPGYCSEVEIKNFSRTMSSQFFDGLGAYNAAMREQRHKESVCDKKACGAMQAYSNVPSVGAELKKHACGNVEIMMNFHPDTSRKMLDTLSNSFVEAFWTGIENPIRSVALPNKANPRPHAYLTTSAPHVFGVKADLTLPPIFGNWTVIKTPMGKNSDDKAGFWKRIFRQIGAIVTIGIAPRIFGTHYKTVDPIIDRGFPENDYAKNLVLEYHKYRMYKKDATGWGGTKSTMYDKDLGASFANDARNAVMDGAAEFRMKTAGKMIKKHVDYLEGYYEDWADNTGEGYSIEPVNHESRRFSGVCNPIIKNTGIIYQEFLFGHSGELSDDYERLGAVGLGKRYQEIGLTSPNKFGNLGVDEKSKYLVNIGGTPDPNQDKTKGEKRGTEFEEYISQTFPSKGEWRSMVNTIDKQVGAFSAMLPEVVIRDMSYHTWHRPYDHDPLTHDGWAWGGPAGGGSSVGFYLAGYDTIWDGSNNGNNDAGVTKTHFTSLIDHNPQELKDAFDLQLALDPNYVAELGYSHPYGGRPWVGQGNPGGPGTNEYWEVCKACEPVDTASGVFIDKGAGLDMDYSGYKNALIANGLEGAGVEEKVLLDLLELYDIKKEAKWTSDWANHYITGERFRNPWDTYNQTVALFGDYGKYVNQYHFRGTGKALFVDNNEWDEELYSGVGYNCTLEGAQARAFEDLSGSTEFEPLVEPIPTTIIHGRVLETGATEARSGVSGEGYYVSTEIKTATDPCWSRWSEAAGTGRWDPAPPCISPLKHSFNLTGTGTDCTAAEAALVAARLTEEQLSPLGSYQNSGCGFIWQDQKELSADWPGSWTGTGVDIAAARAEIEFGDPTAPAGTPANSGYCNWQNFIHNHQFGNGVGYNQLFGLKACLPGDDMGAWTTYIDALPTNGPELTCTYFDPCTCSWSGTYSASITMYGTINGFYALFPTYNASALAWNELLWVSGSFKSIAYDTIATELTAGQDEAGQAGQYNVSTTNNVTTAYKTVAQAGGGTVDIPITIYPVKPPVESFGGTHPTLTYFVDSNGNWKHPIVDNLKDFSTLQGGSAAQSGNATSHSFAAAEAIEYTDNGDGTYAWGGSRYYTSIGGFPERGAGWECILDTDCACVKSLSGEADQPHMIDNEPVVWRETVTGQYARNNWRYYLPLYRNVYSGMFIVSGDYPVVTGSVDWAASKRQVWKEMKHPAEDGLGNPHSMAGQTYWTVDTSRGDNGLVDAPEQYMITYEDAKLVALTGVDGLSAGQLMARNPSLSTLNPNNFPVAKKPSARENQEWDWGKMETGTRSVMFTYAEGTAGGSYDDKGGSPGGDAAFMMGRPLINQEFAGTGPLPNWEGKRLSTYNPATPFGWVVILLDDKTNWQKFKGYTQEELHAWTYKNASMVDGGTSVEAYVKSQHDVGSNKIQWDIQTSSSSFDSAVGKATYLQNLRKHKSHIIRIKDPAKKALDGTQRLLLLFVYENAAAACDSCVSHRIGVGGSDDEGEVQLSEEELFFFNENQKMGMGVTWELRSGDWAFKIPYTVDTQTVLDPRGYTEGTTAGEDLNEVPHDGRTVDVKPWIETVRFAWMDLDGMYTGQESFWAIPGYGQNFEIGCALDQQASKLDKIVDFHHQFHAGGSYETMKAKVKNPDGSDIANTSREWKAPKAGGLDGE